MAPSSSWIKWTDRISSGANYFLEKNQQLYDWVTDKVVLKLPSLPSKAHELYSRLNTRSVVIIEKEGATGEEKRTEIKEPRIKCPKRCGESVNSLITPVKTVFNFFVKTAKRCTSPQSLYEKCKSVKQFVARSALREPYKIPDQDKMGPKGRIVARFLDRIDESLVRSCYVVYFIAETGEKANATLLFIEEITPQLRPSLSTHFVNPVFADLNKLLTGPERDPETVTELLLDTARSAGGDLVEEQGKALVNQYLEDKEKQIIALIERLQGEAQAKASDTVYFIARAGVRYFVVPVVITPLIFKALGPKSTSYLMVPILDSFIRHALKKAGISSTALSAAVETLSICALCHFAEAGYLETFYTAAWALSYFKYIPFAIWAKKLYDLHDPVVYQKVVDVLSRSLTKNGHLNNDPPKEITKYSHAISEQYKILELIQKVRERLPTVSTKSDSPLVDSLQRHFQDFTRDIKKKSEASLRKYELILPSPRVEEIEDAVIPEEVSFAPEDLLSPPPKPSESARVTGAPSLVARTKDVARDLFALTASEPSDTEPKERSARPSLESTLAKGVVLAEDARRAFAAKKETSASTSPTLEEKEPKSSDESESPGSSSDGDERADPPPSVTSTVFTVFADEARRHLERKESGSPAPTSSKGKEPEVPHPSSDDSIPPTRPPAPSTAGSSTSSDLEPIVALARLGADRLLGGEPASPGTRPLDSSRVGRPPVDGTPGEKKDVPPTQPNWYKRAAVAALIVGAILVGIKVISELSKRPEIASRISLPNLQDGNVIKIVSAVAKALLEYFKSISRNEPATPENVPSNP